MPELSPDQIEPPIELFDRCVGGFETDVWSDAGELTQHYAALAGDSAALRETFDRAVRCNDIKRLTLAGPHLAAAGLLGREEVLILARALAGLGRYADAADLLASLGVPAPEDEDRLRLHVGVMAAANRVREALAPVEGALKAMPESAGHKVIRKALSQVLRTLGRDHTDCAELRKLVNALWRLGLDVEAGRRLARALADPRIWTSGSSDERLLLAKTAIGLGVTREALDYLEAFPLIERDDRWADLVLAARVLSGAGRPSAARADDQTAGKSRRVWRALAAEQAGDVRDAIVQLCGLAEAFKRDASIRGALARCVGKAVLAETRPSFTPGRTGRIVNLVTFFNELDLLRLHFEEMAPWVDAFIVVEASSSFTGHEKPLHFEANRALFKDFEHKIVHVPIRAFPEHLASPWAREFYQRDMAIAGASGLCGEEDYILETDVDELIDGRVLDGFEADFASLDLRLSRFFLNYRPSADNPSRTQMKSSIFKARYRQRYGVSYSRIVLGGWDRRSHVLRDAGWHLTSMMEAAAISLKVHSYSHQEQTKEKYRSVDHFERTLERIREGDLDPGWDRVDLDDSFPASVRRNPEAFAKVLLQPPSDRRLAS